MYIKVRDWVLKLAPDSTPGEIAIEVSTRCNLSCLHCFRFASRTIRHMDMDLETYIKMIDNAVDSGVKRIVFTGWGEPTINPYILEMLEYAKRKNLYVILNTNGILLNELSKDIVKLGVDEVYVSIDTVDIETYQKIRRYGELSKVSSGLTALNELKKMNDSGKPIVNSIFTINKLNIDRIDSIIKYSVDFGIQNIYLSFYIPYQGRLEDINCVNDHYCINKLKEKMEKISIELISKPIKLWLPNIDSYSSRECPFVLNKALFTRVDGKVSSCLFLAYSWVLIIDQTPREVREYIIGDALLETFSEIWRKNYEMLFKLSFTYMPSCLDCSLRRYCSYTLKSDTDCWGNSPNCSFCPYHYRFSYCPL
ncbi:MAG: radical SAM protein [Desulfurococcaceae archaeon]